MNFLAPAFLLGLGALALPVLAHVLGRQPPRDVPFAAVRFLPEAEPVVRQRRTLRDRGLLLVRLLLLAAAVLVFSRPAVRHEGPLRVVAQVHDCVLLVDASGSMAMQIDGASHLEHAVERATAILEALPTGSKVGLWTTDPGGPRLEPTADPSRVREALERWLDDGAPRWGAWRLAEALPGAATMLPRAGDRPRFIYAIGDRFTGGLAELPSAWEGIPVLPIPASDEDAPEHVALLAVTWEPAAEIDPRAVRVQATVRRAGPAKSEAPREVAVALHIAGEEVTRTTVTLAPDSERRVEFTPTLTEDGQVAAKISLVHDDPDPLPIDEARHLWLSAERDLEVLVVNGDPSELRAHDEVYFFNTAIAASQATGSLRIAMRSMAPDQLDQDLRRRGAQALHGVDVLVLANVQAPAPDVAETLLAAVRGGMGLWITAGDRLDPQAYNATLLPLLPLPMRDAMAVGTAPGRTEARVEHLAPPVLSHPIFAGFRDVAGLETSRAKKIVLLEPEATRPHEVALSFTSGAPALITSTYGSGRVALLTTTIDRDWADLPLRPGFVPLVLGTLSFLGDSGADLAHRRVRVGEPLVLGGDTPVLVTMPNGREISVRPDKDGALVLKETYLPGHYRVRRNDADATVFVVEVDPAESTTTAADPPASPELEEASSFVSKPQWRALLLGLVVLLAIESLWRWRRAVSGTKR